jgi:hypothetical protein
MAAMPKLTEAEFEAISDNVLQRLGRRPMATGPVGRQERRAQAAAERQAARARRIQEAAAVADKIKERNRSIIERLRDGATLRAIGSDLNIRLLQLFPQCRNRGLQCDNCAWLVRWV